MNPSQTSSNLFNPVACRLISLPDAGWTVFELGLVMTLFHISQTIMRLIDVLVNEVFAMFFNLLRVMVAFTG